MNDSSLEHVFSTRLSLWDILLLFFLLLFIMTGIISLLFNFTPAGNLLPDRLNAKLKNQINIDAYCVDSLKSVVESQTKYISAIKVFALGAIPQAFDIDSLNYDSLNYDSIARVRVKLLYASDREKKFRKDYEESGKFNLINYNDREKDNLLVFYNPVSGTIISGYSPLHDRFGVGIKTGGRKAVMSVLGGTVVFSGFSLDLKNVVVVQHDNSYISIYRNLSGVLKKQGDVVNTGEVLGYVDRDDTSGDNPVLFFEIWNEGNSVNPKDVVAF